MVDFLQMVFEVLRVQDLASQYSGTLDQFLYVLFFPSIFIILIIYMIAHRVALDKGPKGFSAVLGIAIYIFIIVWPPNAQYSLYSAVAPLGKLWFILVIILVGIWAIIKTFFPGGGGAAGGAQSASGLGTQLTKAAWNKISGRENALVKTINSQMDIFEKMNPADARDISDMVRAIKTDLDALYGMSEVGGVRVFKDHEKLLNRFERIAKKKKAVI